MCLQAKQTPLSYGTSENKALNPFDLVHHDIWGAHYMKSLCDASYFLSLGIPHKRKE